MRPGTDPRPLVRPRPEIPGPLCPNAPGADHAAQAAPFCPVNPLPRCRRPLSGLRPPVFAPLTPSFCFALWAVATGVEGIFRAGWTYFGQPPGWQKGSGRRLWRLDAGLVLAACGDREIFHPVRREEEPTLNRCPPFLLAVGKSPTQPIIFGISFSQLPTKSQVFRPS